ncbi:UPF0271 protein [Cyclobacterium lianum]|uniref:UPF0271 protein n=1 Tax=Cyclobacterium lianum TaxID=388280 RepID=A0A1M7QIC5_9BACT|nr:5-oxoprolinase subunit PxpA [Cyclobacterium lianum]SHN30836.1 UPF0271 protein [Cyclobacterium lianum]
MKSNLDINCDLGEGMPTDRQIMPYLGSCNIACGAHAGDDNCIAETVKMAKKYLVNIGAHPSYPDRANFGRVSLYMESQSLKKSLKEQIDKVKNQAQKEGLPLHHIKFHGALYLDSLKDQELADLLAAFVKDYYPDQLLYAPFGSCMAIAASQRNLRLRFEVFADRRYSTATTLLPRKHPGALLTDLTEIAEQVSLILNEGKVKAHSGELLAICADTICIHGDHPQAVSIAKMISSKLIANTKQP